ncbi:hypothetical protein BDP27DRAFT_1444860, partial [Rhodocollybia butyracea]
MALSKEANKRVRDWATEAPPPHPEINNGHDQYFYGFTVSDETLLEYERLHPDYREQNSNYPMQSRKLGLMRLACRPLGIEHNMSFDFRILRPDTTRCEHDIMYFAAAGRKTMLLRSPTLEKLEAVGKALGVDGPRW